MSSQVAKPANPAPFFAIVPIAPAATNFGALSPDQISEEIRKYLSSFSLAACTRSIVNEVLFVPYEESVSNCSDLESQSVPTSGTRAIAAAFDREGDEIFRLKVVHMTLAAGPRDGPALQRQHGKEIGQSPATDNRIEPLARSGSWVVIPADRDLLAIIVMRRRCPSA